MIFMAKKAMYGPKQKLLIHAAKGYFEPKLTDAAWPNAAENYIKSA